MNAFEACSLLAGMTIDLAESRRECDSWRLVALVAIRQNAELQRDLEILDARGHIHRTRTQDDRDAWLDQTDLRRVERAA
jgi:hypothetical protein